MKITRPFTYLFAAGLMLLAAFAPAATVPETSADNDMDPCYTNDGWVNSVGSYDCITPSGFISHAFVTPPDGNNYGGGVQFSGVPGTQETIQKTYTNLVSGQVYAVEWHVMTDVVTGVGPSAEAWFEVTLCADQQDTLRLVPSQRRTWFQQRLFFTANATTCSLSFRARNTTGDNSSWIFLDGVAISAAASSDLGITKTAPSQVPVGGGNGTYSITVVNNGPDATGGTVDVTEMLPIGVSVNGGAAGAVVLGGANAGDWTCSSDAAVPQVVSCTRTGTLANSVSSTFSYTVNFAAGALGDILNSTASVVPTFGTGTQDTNAANNSSPSTTILTATPTATLTAASIPTLSEWGLIGLFLLLAGLGTAQLRKRSLSGLS